MLELKIRLKQNNGFTISEEMKSNPKQCRTPEILASSGGNDEDGGIGTLLLINLFKDRLKNGKPPETIRETEANSCYQLNWPGAKFRSFLFTHTKKNSYTLNPIARPSRKLLQRDRKAFS